MRSGRSVRRGISLIEILLGIAMTGAIVTMVMPGYRRMMRRAKNAEAKVELGQLYSRERAFFGETNFFGNNLIGIGYATETQEPRYAVGFPGTAGTCTNTTDIAQIIPAATTSVLADPQAPRLQYNPTTKKAEEIPLNPADYVTLQFLRPLYFSNGMATLSGRTGPGLCSAGSVAADGQSYTASASGCLKNECAATSPVVPGDGTVPVQDVWKIDQRRNLTHPVEGA